MPEACDVCPCMYDYIQCTALKDNAHESLSACDDYTKRQAWCPIKEVVQCKDCKYVAPDMECGHPNETLNPLSRNNGNPNWFCADAEPKEHT